MGPSAPSELVSFSVREVCDEEEADGAGASLRIEVSPRGIRARLEAPAPAAAIQIPRLERKPEEEDEEEEEEEDQLYPLDPLLFPLLLPVVVDADLAGACRGRRCRR